MGLLQVCISMWLGTRTISDENINRVTEQGKYNAFLHGTSESIKYSSWIVYSMNSAMPTRSKTQITGISVLGMWWIAGFQDLLGADYRDQAIESLSPG